MSWPRRVHGAVALEVHHLKVIMTNEHELSPYESCVSVRVSPCLTHALHPMLHARVPLLRRVPFTAYPAFFSGRWQVPFARSDEPQSTLSRRSVVRGHLLDGTDASGATEVAAAA